MPTPFGPVFAQGRGTLGWRWLISTGFSSSPPITAVRSTFRGLLRSTDGDQEGALADFNEAIHLDPGNVDAHTARALILGKKGEIEAALRDLDAAVALHPCGSAQLIARAVMRAQKGVYRLALRDIAQVVGFGDWSWITEPFGWQARSTLINIIQHRK